MPRHLLAALLVAAACAAPARAQAPPPMDNQTCLGCHDPENSPHFDFNAYLPKILGKGHAAHASK